LISTLAPTPAPAVLALVLGYNWVVMKAGVADIPPFAFAAAVFAAPARCERAPLR